MGLLLFLAALAAPQEKDEAGELLRKVEKAITSNLTVRFTVRSELRIIRTFKSGGVQLLAHVSQINVELAPGHRARIEGMFPVEGIDWPDPLPPTPSPPLPESGSAWMTIISDGWMLALGPYMKPPTMFAPAPKRLNRSLIADFLRLGVRETVTKTLRELAFQKNARDLNGAADSPKAGESKSASWLQHAEATYLGPEKVDGVDTLKLQLNPSKGTGPASPVSTLWIDAKTFLPLRRETRTKGADWEKTHVEQYTEFTTEAIN
ncbi:MAG TPA: hypothetical protein VFC86_10805 [Planctomycetota bacterium]|nr:hypothetical protein [Planctomycetota bacterium]